MSEPMPAPLPPPDPVAVDVGALPEGARGLAARREELLGRAAGGPLVLDLHGVPSLDSLEAAAVLSVVLEGRQRGLEVRLRGLAPAARDSFAGLGADLLDEKTDKEQPLPLMEQIGAGTLGYLDVARRILHLIGELTHWLVIAPRRGKPIKWDRISEQLVKIGADGVPIVAFLSFLIGAVLALNGARQLRLFGAAIYVADLVGVAMTREMGPLITAIIVSARSGSAITAELGTMVVSEEIDAMRTMALSPERFLLVPRITALLIALPCLTVLSNLTGIFGGYWVGVVLLQLGTRTYIEETGEALLISDVTTGLIKSVVFAFLIGMTACYRGLYVRGGAEEVGNSTTSSVVISIVLCILANAVFTTIFYYVQ